MAGPKVRRLGIAVALVLALLLSAAAGAEASESTVVLGARAYAGPQGVGWGTAHPSEIFNGGDASGLVRHIHWASWGGAEATGRGLNAIFKPAGGYYRRPATIKLRATEKGRCSSHGPVAYRRLLVRVPSRPDGPLGPWVSWSGSKTLCRFGF